MFTLLWSLDIIQKARLLGWKVLLDRIPRRKMMLTPLFNVPHLTLLYGTGVSWQ